MNEQARKWYGIVAAAVVVITALGIYFAAHKRAVAPATTTGSATSTTTTNSTAGGSQPVQITSIPDTSDIPKPNLDRPYTPPSNLPASVQAASKKAVADAVAQLKIDPNHIAYWLQLAIYRKGANDFAGAEEVWLYCTKRWPTDPISYENLADMYAYNLNQPAKAVEYWNKAIPLDKPNSIRLYVALATFQSINMKDKAAARATLEAGLKANPGNADLQNALNTL